MKKYAIAALRPGFKNAIRKIGPSLASSYATSIRFSLVSAGTLEFSCWNHFVIVIAEKKDANDIEYSIERIQFPSKA